MPVMDGITLMKKVEEEFPDIVFVVLTNLEEFELARQAMKYRAVDYLDVYKRQCLRKPGMC